MLMADAMEFPYFVPLRPRYNSTPEYTHGVDSEGNLKPAYAEICPYVLDARNGLPPGTRAAVIHAAFRWKASANPAHALCAIVAAYQAGVYPHPELLSWLCSGLGRWFVEDGCTLDAALLKEEGKGHTKTLKLARKEAFIFQLCGEMFGLIKAFGLGAEDAAECVEARLYQELDGTTKPGRKVYKTSTLKQYYNTEHGEYWRRLAEEPAAPSTGNSPWSMSDREAMALAYPITVRDRFLEV